MAKISQIKVGNTYYDINLPTTATPKITGLTVTTLTVTGTANLSVIKNGEATLNLPSSSGTLALAADIPSKTAAFTSAILISIPSYGSYHMDAGTTGVSISREGKTAYERSYSGLNFSGSTYAAVIVFSSARISLI